MEFYYAVIRRSDNIVDAIITTIVEILEDEELFYYVPLEFHDADKYGCLYENGEFIPQPLKSYSMEEIEKIFG